MAEAQLETCQSLVAKPSVTAVPSLFPFCLAISRSPCPDRRHPAQRLGHAPTRRFPRACTSMPSPHAEQTGPWSWSSSGLIPQHT